MKILRDILNHNVAVYSIIVLCFIVSLGQTLYFSLNPDTSWLMTSIEGMLSGKILGIDILESNPPASILIYMPGVLISDLTGLKSEIGVALSIYALTVFACFFMQSVARKTNIIEPESANILNIILVTITCLYFQRFFAQREHIAALFALPYIILSAVRMQGREQKFATWIILGAGIGMGVTASIKPVFILVPLLCSLSVVLFLKKWRAFFALENIIAGVVFLLYVGIIFLFFSDYIIFLKDLLFSAYLERHITWERVFFSEGFLFVVMLVVYVSIAAFFKQSILQRQFFVASIGFYLAFLIQRKGYFYQVYPALILLYLACALLCRQIIKRECDQKYSLVIKAPVIVILVYTVLSTATILFSSWNLVERPRQAESYIQNLSPHPTMASLSGTIGAGFPLSRNVQAVWVGSTQSIFTAPHLQLDEQARVLGGEYDAPFLAPEKWLIERVCQDIQKHKPDIVVLEHLPSWTAFVFSHSVVQEVMSEYRLATTRDGTDIWVRKEKFPEVSPEEKRP